MKICILFSSPRKDGNTASLLMPFRERMEEAGHTCTQLDLYDMDLLPCLACRGCQKDWTIPGCVRNDDMDAVFSAVLESDMILLASPIYAWYCTAPLKTALDRMVYALNKYYGDEKGPSIWKGRKVAIITTCGYKPEKGADLWEEGMKRTADTQVSNTPACWQNAISATIQSSWTRKRRNTPETSQTD